MLEELTRSAQGGRAGKDLVCARAGRDPGGGMNANPRVSAAVEDGIRELDTDADFGREAGLAAMVGERPLDRDGSFQPRPRLGKGEEEAVAGTVDDLTLVFGGERTNVMPYVRISSFQIWTSAFPTKAFEEPVGRRNTPMDEDFPIRRGLVLLAVTDDAIEVPETYFKRASISNETNEGVKRG